MDQRDKLDDKLAVEEPERPKDYSIKEYVLFKLDRNIALVGLVTLGVYALYKGTDGTEKIISAVIAALGVYLGTRVGKN